MGGKDPYSEYDEFTRYSPRRHIHQVNTPTLITHGDTDYRVPVGQSLALFEALRHHRKQAELLIFPDETHHIERPANSAAWYDAVFDFLHRHTR